MVDRISGSGNNINEANLLGLGANQGTEKVGGADANATKTEKAKQTDSADNAAISDEARQAYEADKDVLRYTRLAMREKQPVNSEKVAQFKAMLDSGRINDYLRSLNTDNLAASMLQSSSGKFLSAV